MYWLLLALSVIAIAYFLLIKPFRYWELKGLSPPNAITLLVEHIHGILQLTSQTDIISSIYRRIGKDRYGGSFQFLTPILFLKDPNLIKQITIKDFDHFVDHHVFVSEEIEPLLGQMIFALKGDRWKNMRATLSPSFTSSKMRAMFRLMTECAEQFVDFFQNESTKTVTVDFKDAFTRYANDVIASTAFGITCNSLKEPENEFYIMGKKMFNFSGIWNIIKQFFILLTPKLAKLFGFQVFDKHVYEFFRSLVKTNIESREKNDIVRPDMIHLLMEARKGRLKHEEQLDRVIDAGFAAIEESAVGMDEKRQIKQLSNDDITAQVLLFFFAGFENISTLMCFVSYELAINCDVQERLRNEVDDTLTNCNGSLTYEGLLKMKFMDMVISETLRKWPIAILGDRVCVKPYTIEPTKNGENPVYLKVGDIIWIPIFALHRDKQFYPEPDRFDPERFNDENKAKINPYSYLPFGAGPRSCIGSRFALLETKTVLFYLLLRFEIVVVQKSTVPLKLARNLFNLTVENGFWFGLKPRKYTT